MGKMVSCKLARQLLEYMIFGKKTNTVFSMVTSKYLLLLMASFEKKKMLLLEMMNMLYFSILDTGV